LKGTKRFSMAVLCVFMSSYGSYSFGENTKVINLGEIFVTTETRVDVTTTEVGVKIIEKGKNINLPDVLKDVPGIDIKRRASVGDTADILSIRGFSGNRIMLNIDGRPVNAAGVVGGYYIDWGTIPLDNIEKIELIRGGGSAEYGNNAMGGVINVITKKPSETPRFTFFGNYGGGRGIDPIENIRITHTFKVGPLGYSLAGSFQKAGAFLWNNNFEGRNLSANMDLDMPAEGVMRFGFQYAFAERGFIRENRQSTNPDSTDFYMKKDDDYPLSFGETFSPYSGTAFIPGPGAFWDKTKYYLDFGYEQPVWDGKVELKIYKNHEDRKEKNYSSSLINPAYDDGALVLDRDVASDRSYGGCFKVRKPFENHNLIAGYEHKVLAYGNTDLNFIDTIYNNWWAPVTGYKSSSKGICHGLFLQDAWFMNDALALTAGVRWDSYENQSIHGSTSPELKDDNITPKLTASYTMTDRDEFTLSAYQALRTPGLPETYWWAEGMTKGSPVLSPEKNNALEISYQRKFIQPGYFRLSGYYYKVDDYIMFRFDPSWRGVYNINEAVLTGFSVDMKKQLASRVSGIASITYQKTRKEGDLFDTAGLTDRIDYLPEWKANAGLELRLPFDSLVRVLARYVDERQTIYAYSYGSPAQKAFKLMTLDSSVTADLDFKIPVTKKGELGLYVENLFDKGIEEQFGYPLPGRIIGASAKIMF